MIRALFVNSGILGQKTFARFIAKSFTGETDGIRGRQVILTENLTLGDRILRRVLCTRLWPDGLAGSRNLDLLRYRAEWNAGLVARKRIRELEAAGGPFDVLHFHRHATAYASLERMRRTPSIVTIDCTQRCVLMHARTSLEKRSYEPNVRRDGRIFDAARLIIAASRWAAESVRQEYPSCTTEIVVMPNPVQLDAFDSAWSNERYERSGTPGFRPRVLFMGGDFARKGGDVLLTAWREGTFAERASLDLVTSSPPANIPAGVTVHTGIDVHSTAWREFWRLADVFVMPSRDEAFGLVFQEAAAAGVPSIATRINALPEQVLHGETGLLIEPNDADAIGRALDELLASRDRRRALGDRARAYVSRTADPNTYRMSLAAAIHKVARL